MRPVAWVTGLLMLLIALPAAATEGVTGQVVTPAGAPLPDAIVSAGADSAVTDAGGRFHLPGAGPGEITLSRVAYADRTVAWDGESDWLTVPLVARTIHAIHVAGWVAADAGDWDSMLDLVRDTTINAVVVDIKNENGHVFHRSDLETVERAGSQAVDTFDLEAIVSEAQAADAYVIVRIVTFQDPIVAEAFPDMSIRDRRTGRPFNQDGQRFLDPTDPRAREFGLDLAEEACRAGVDEVQFDYVRFPAADLSQAVFDGRADATGRRQAIASFLAEARRLLHPLGCATAADIFGWITNTPGEGGIGQQLEAVAGAVDVVSPMMYPSHYESGWYGFAVPNDHPAEVVTYASRDALRRMRDSAAVLRPWIQDFWYTPGQVRAQIDALDGLGLGWMSWNILSQFSRSAYPPAGILTAGTSAPPVTEASLGRSGFWDVPDEDVFADDVAWMGDSAITAGCNPPYSDFYCPDRAVTRGEMAAFLVRGLALGAGEDPGFSDDDGVFGADIAALAAAGITRGCDPPVNSRFCPERAVTRGEMAAFLRRALG
ncbi:MAG TPA: putative glycoside hydrolase [Acidimicrobiia bacterium]|nr:putative glycoside hydrolase [Acidimicrobiia bacterium]